MKLLLKTLNEYLHNYRTFILRDACYLTMERGLGFLKYEQMSNIVSRYIVKQQKKAQNYKAECLRYRGVVYKQLDK